MAKQQIIAKSPFMKKLMQDLDKIAKSHARIFINGESGTGKEVIAQAIHYQSLRSKNPFVKVNCAAIPTSLLESEFFGHERGAFTGAISRHIGRFELADKGTLLLDEISEIPLSVQSKLLRAVQEQEFERVGGTSLIRTDIRFISTSNRNMQEAIQNQHFREDLYFRLNVIPIYLPPLRERKEDILPLAEYFLQEHQLTSDAKEKLLDYHWPGNVRELANIIERTIVMSSEKWIDASSLLLETPKKPMHSALSLKEVEKLHILRMLADHNQNRTKAAKALGISVRTLRNKLAAYKSQ